MSIDTVHEVTWSCSLADVEPDMRISLINEVEASWFMSEIPQEQSQQYSETGQSQVIARYEFLEVHDLGTPWFELRNEGKRKSWVSSPNGL